MALREVHVMVPDERLAQMYRLVADWLTVGDAGAPTAPRRWGEADEEEARYVLNRCTPTAKKLLRVLAGKEGGGMQAFITSSFELSESPWMEAGPDDDEVTAYSAEDLAKAASMKGQFAVAGSLGSLRAVAEQVGRDLPYKVFVGQEPDPDRPQPWAAGTWYFMEPSVARLFGAVS